MFTIYTYGHIDIVFQVLNAIAMVLSHELIIGIIQLSALILLARTAIQGSFQATLTALYKAEMIKRLIMIVLIYAGLTVKAPMRILDEVNKLTDKVDNLPIIFVAPVGIIEYIGTTITALFDQAFSQPGSFNYTNYGSNFAASLISEARNFKIQDPMLAASLDSFMDRCVLRPAAMGAGFTWEDLFNSADLWDGLIKSKVKDGGLRRAQIYTYPGGERKSLPCKSAFLELDKRFNKEILNFEKVISKTLFGRAGRDQYLDRNNRVVNGKAFELNLKKVFTNYLDTPEVGGIAALKQIMFLHQLSRFGDYGALRAISNQENAWQISGKIAGYYLPMLLTVMKCLLYSSIIFILPLTLLTGQVTMLYNMLMMAASFQLWPALYTVLNMISDMGSDVMVDHLARGAVSLATFSSVTRAADKIVAIAAGLQLSVPFLASALMKGGMDALVHMAGNLTGVTTQSASSAAHEVTSGNKSFDNVQMNNVSSHKTDLSSMYKADASLMQRVDGSVMRATTGGKMMVDRGTGFNFAHSPETQRHTISNAQVTARAMYDQITKTDSAREATSRTQSIKDQQSSSIVEQIMNNANAIKNWAAQSSSDEAKQLTSVINSAEQIMKTEGKSQDVAFGTTFGVSVGFGGSKIGAQGAYNSTQRTGDDQQQSVQGSNSINDTQSLLYRLSKDDSFNEVAGISKTQAINYQRSYDQAQEAAQSYSQEQTKMMQLGKSATLSSTVSTETTIQVDPGEMRDMRSNLEQIKSFQKRRTTSSVNSSEIKPPKIDNAKFQPVVNKDELAFNQSAAAAQIKQQEQLIGNQGVQLKQQVGGAQAQTAKKVADKEEFLGNTLNTAREQFKEKTETPKPTEYLKDK